MAKRLSVASLQDHHRLEPIKADSQLFGIEIEVEGAGAVMENIPDLPDFQRHWHIVTDHSLRNEGMEFVSVILKKDQVPEAITKFYSLWDRAKFKSSIRCGIHVHMNCLDRYLDELGGVFTTYSIVEPLLYSYCGTLREENIYCVPWYRSPGQVDTLSHAIRILGPRKVYSAYQSISRLCKYSGLYAGPLSRFGTIEFRHAPTWRDAAKLRVWIAMLEGIMQYGVKRSPEQVLDAWHNNARLLLSLIFGDNLKQFGGNHIDLIEESGCISVAEKFVPTKTSEKDWKFNPLYVQGEGVKKYAQTPIDVLPRPNQIEIADADATPRQTAARVDFEAAVARVQAREARLFNAPARAPRTLFEEYVRPTRREP